MVDINKLRGIKNSSPKTDFDLNKHIIFVINKHDFPIVSPIQKRLIKIGIEQNKGPVINRLESNDGFAKSQEHTYFPENSNQHIEGCQYLDSIFEQLCQGPATINQDIKKLKEQNKISFRIIQSEKADAFATTLPNGRKEIAFQSGMFTECDAGTIALVLGHELGHIIEQQSRPPEGKIKGINCKAVELFCDVVGKSVAENAGYNTSQFSQLLQTASAKRNQDDSNDDHPSAANRLKVLQNISCGTRHKDNNVPAHLQNIMLKNNWPQQNLSRQLMQQTSR